MDILNDKTELRSNMETNFPKLQFNKSIEICESVAII